MAVAQMNTVYYMEPWKLPKVLDFQIIPTIKKYGSQNAVRRGQQMLSKWSVRSGTNKTVHLLSRAMCSEPPAQHGQAAGVQPQLTHSQHTALQQHRSTWDSVLPFLQRWKTSKHAIESAFLTPQITGKTNSDRFWNPHPLAHRKIYCSKGRER